MEVLTTFVTKNSSVFAPIAPKPSPPLTDPPRRVERAAGPLFSAARRKHFSNTGSETTAHVPEPTAKSLISRKLRKNGAFCMESPLPSDDGDEIHPPSNSFLNP